MTENIISHVAIASLSVCADPGSEPECGKAERLNEHQYKLYKSCKMQKRGYALFCSLLSLTSFEVNETAQNRIFFSLRVKTSNTSYFSNRLKSSVLSRVVVPHGL